MKLYLLDYMGRKNEEPVEFDENEIIGIKIYVVSGDEVCIISYRNGDIGFYDPFASTRCKNRTQDCYTVYSPTVNLLHDSEFLCRRTSDWHYLRTYCNKS